MPKGIKSKTSAAGKALARKSKRDLLTHQQNEKKIQDTIWEEEDKKIVKKQQRKAEKQLRQEQALKRKRETKKLLEEEEKQLEIINSNEKHTYKELQIEFEKEVKSVNKHNIQHQYFQHENPNILEQVSMETLTARSIDDAISILSNSKVKDRSMVSYQSFKAQNLKLLKAEYPTLNYSQLLQKVAKKYDQVANR